MVSRSLSRRSSTFSEGSSVNLLPRSPQRYFARWWRTESAEHKCEHATEDLLLQRAVDIKTQPHELDETRRYLDPFTDNDDNDGTQRKPKSRQEQQVLFEMGINAAVERQHSKIALGKDRALEVIRNAWNNDDKYAMDVAVQNAKVLLGGDVSLERGGSLALSLKILREKLPCLSRWCCWRSPYVMNPCANAYINSVRMRLAYFLLSTFVLMVSCSVGIAVETIFAAFNGVFHPTSSTWMFVVLPLLMILFAMICDTVSVLFRDACTDPPFCQLQAAVLILTAWLKELWTEKCKCFSGLFVLTIPSIGAFFWRLWHRDFPLSVVMGLLLLPLLTAVLVPVVAPRSNVATWWTCFWTDVAMLLCFEVIPFAAGIRGIYEHGNCADQRGWVGAFLRSYQWGGIVSACIAAVAFRTCNLVCAWNAWKYGARDIREIHGNFRESYNRFVRKIRYHRVPAGMLHQLYEALFPDFDGQVFAASSLLPRVEIPSGLSISSRVEDGHVVGLENFLAAKTYKGKKVCCYLGVAFCLWLVNIAALFLQLRGLVILADWVHKWALLALPIAFALIVFFISLALELAMPRIFGTTYTWMLILFGILLALLISDANYHGDWEADQLPTITNGTKHWSGFPQRYGVCERRWGHLSALDLAQLAQLAYLQSCDDITEKLALAFPHSQATVSNCTNVRHFPRTVIFDFPPRVGHSNKTRVISYKGTSTPQDANVDLILWSTIKVFQWLSSIVPVLNIMSKDQVQWMIRRAHIPGQVDAERLFWNKSITWLQDLINDRPDHVVLTGHSLGGGIAQVVAAKMGLNAVVFSPPGMGYSAVRFGVYEKHAWDQWMVDRTSAPPEEFGVQHAKRLITAVMPDFDQVPRVDLQLGQVQHIECRMKPHLDGFAQDPCFTTCHGLKKTICELWRVCGDERERFFSCNEILFKEGHPQTQWYKPDDVV